MLYKPKISITSFRKSWSSMLEIQASTRVLSVDTCTSICQSFHLISLTFSMSLLHLWRGRTTWLNVKLVLFPNDLPFVNIDNSLRWLFKPVKIQLTKHWFKEPPQRIVDIYKDPLFQKHSSLLNKVLSFALDLSNLKNDSRNGVKCAVITGSVKISIDILQSIHWQVHDQSNWCKECPS